MYTTTDPPLISEISFYNSWDIVCITVYNLHLGTLQQQKYFYIMEW